MARIYARSLTATLRIARFLADARGERDRCCYSVLCCGIQSKDAWNLPKDLPDNRALELRIP